MTLPTLKIEDGSGDYIVINESDFDEKIHKLFGESSQSSLEKVSDSSGRVETKNSETSATPKTPKKKSKK